MDFDAILETWRTQDTVPPYDVNHDVLRQALRAEEVRARRLQRFHRRSVWFCWIFGTGMAVFAGFWIAITITNGWPVIYVITSAVSVGAFALGGIMMWLSRGPRVEPGRNFGSTLQDEVRRSLALVDYQLSHDRHWAREMLAAVSLCGGSLLFSWTVNRSQHIPDSSPSHWGIVVIVVFFAWASLKDRKATREAESKLSIRQRHLRELLAALEARE
jgi:hypothetical protein